MDCNSTRLTYRQTGVFSKIATDYADSPGRFSSFIAHEPTPAGIRQAIEARKAFPTDRQTLVSQLKVQYKDIPAHNRVRENIEALLSPDTFTVTTAHQNNIFTGPLYFIYKIVHAIKLADYLNESLLPHKFVPVYYIGSEDADLAELNHIYLDGAKHVWDTKQKGAVGRMILDDEFAKLIRAIEGQLAVLPHGTEVIALLKEAYKLGDNLQTATFKMVNALFAAYGLIVLLPDNAVLKQQMISVFEDDILHQTASTIVSETSGRLEKLYKVQAHPRAINLFYLEGDKRERIEVVGDRYEVLNTSLSFTKEEILHELRAYPERFSPNVILRGIYQEVILPNVVFIGGGGELAYWLELKDLFDHYHIPYPVQVLRNSFLILEKKWQEKIDKLGFSTEEIFLSEDVLIKRLVKRTSDQKLELNGTLTATEQLYDSIRQQATSIDRTLERHVEALKTVTLYRLRELEKKMLRAEKRKYAEQQRHIRLLKEKLFPGNGLQERHDNMLYYFAKWGNDLFRILYDQSPALEQEFVVLRPED